jgi:hypothetical protein
MRPFAAIISACVSPLVQEVGRESARQEGQSE